MSEAVEPSDEALARRSAAGDQDAFVELIRRYEGPLAALIRYRIGNSHDAEDVFQETLLQAWAGIRDLRNPDKVLPWLLQVARNRCRDFERSPQRRSEPTDPRLLVERLNHHGRAVARAGEMAAEVHDALERVPQRQREAAKLFYLKGLTIAEIAKRSRRPQGTVKRWLFDARRHIRGTLGLAPAKTKEEEHHEQ